MKSALRLAAVAVAVMAGLSASPVAAQDPPTESGCADPLNPQGTNVVESWSLAPGDVGATGNGRAAFVFDAPPGGSIADSFTIFNFGNVPMDFTLYSTDAFNAEDGALSLLPAEEEPTDLGSWIDLSVDALNVPPCQQGTFDFVLHVPADATPGDHAGAVLASSVAPGTSPDGRVVDVDRRTGTRVYLRVQGPLDAELAVEDVEATYEPALNPAAGKVEVAYTIVNRGNVRLLGSHRVTIGGPFGLFEKSSGAISIPELLPGESANFTQSFDDVLATGLAFTEIELDPAAPAGAPVDEITADGRRSIDVAVPFAVLAALLTSGLAVYARRSYTRHVAEGSETVPELVP